MNPTQCMKAFLPAALCLCALTWGRAAAQTPLRPPAVPLVAHDPYFSIWSPADRLTDACTTHWTGRPHPLRSLIRVDGQVHRVMGLEPEAAPPLPQTGLSVLPTRTLYRFADARVRLTLTFLTPALPSDLDVLARPVTYIAWDVQSADGKPHAIQVYFDCGAELAVDVPQQEVVWERPKVAGLSVLKLGSKDQRVLARKGDDLRIDWGHVYLAAAEAHRPGMAIAAGAEARKEFAARGALPARDEPPGPRAVQAGAPALAVGFDLGQVGPAAVSRWIMLAYDDEHSIKYFESRLRPYWRRGGADAAGLLQAAAGDYASLAPRCAKFDEDLTADLTRAGGEQYALLCALAYRQTLAGNKLAADAKGMPLLFPKENFSNGCISTVDVLFPQAPFFLVLSPALAKAMLAPVLDYAASPRWKYGYAPHDLGTYPFATGQVYGMSGGDGGRMPVEESGNMLIMLAALARAEGDGEFIKKYWPLLTRWADYLVANGLDPENQLCSADMFGHLPHCANLALKAILGIAGYAQLCEVAGRPEEARKYMAIARRYAAKWQELAKDEGRTRLAYHLPGTWGMKHNLIWDRVLGTRLFPDSVGDAEIAWYLKVQNKYGLPVDNRTPTSLIDWAVWSIAPARDPRDFQALVGPIFQYARQTPSRVPLADWFVTTDGRRQGFQARPVVGGLFIMLLSDPAAWKTWAGRAAKVSGTWAEPSIHDPGAMKEIVPTARNAPVTWRFTTEKPGADWHSPAFDDSAWREGPGGFGTKHTPGAVVRTEWSGKVIWLRRSFTLGSDRLADPRLRAHCDEDGSVYLNGVPAAELPGYTTDYEDFPINPEARAALRPGKNLLAVQCRQTYGGQYIDVGIVDSAPVPNAAPGLRKLFDEPLRDPAICLGPDRTYYLTGTSPPFWGYNNESGIRLWKSKDLVAWEPLGTVWRYGASPWHAAYLKAKKPLWAPEVHYLKNTFWLTYSVPGWDGTANTSGSGLLKSTTGKAEGPYQDMCPAERLGDEIDASLFEDDDGQVYFLWHSGKIGRLKPDMTGLAEPYRWLRTSKPDPDPKRHSRLCAGIFGPKSFDHVGFEGMFLFKAGGRYFLSCAEQIEGRYSCMVATSAKLDGPYGERYEAIPHGGHNTFFLDAQGRRSSTFFGPPWYERPAILPVRIGDEPGAEKNALNIDGRAAGP